MFNKGCICWRKEFEIWILEQCLLYVYFKQWKLLNLVHTVTVTVDVILFQTIGVSKSFTELKVAPIPAQIIYNLSVRKETFIGANMQ
jgi:hypothetical protein